MARTQVSKEVTKELLLLANRLVNDGYVERNGDILILTNKGRTEALLRWRGLCDDVKILIILWFREQLSNETKGGV